MFTFISQLIGCAQAVPLSGPDFSHSMEKVIHLGHKISVFYLVPGNFSKELNFDKIYVRDTARSFQINPNQLAKPETLTWREYDFIDMGNWDYWGKKSEGPGGQLGGLRVGIGYRDSAQQCAVASAIAFHPVSNCCRYKRFVQA